MSTHITQPWRRRVLLAATPFIVGLLATACSSDPTATETSAGATTMARVTTTTTVAGSTTTPTTAQPPVVTPDKPAATTTTSGSSLLSIPPVTLHLGPKVTSLTTQNTSLTCAQAIQLGYKVDVVYTTVFAATADLHVATPHLVVTLPGQPANGTKSVGIDCGGTSTLEITAVAADGTRSAMKSLTVTVGS